jgi:hypothetical protein
MTAIRQPDSANYPEASDRPCLHCGAEENVRSYITDGGLFGQAWIDVCDACIARPRLPRLSF